MKSYVKTVQKTEVSCINMTFDLLLNKDDTPKDEDLKNNTSNTVWYCLPLTPPNNDILRGETRNWKIISLLINFVF